MIWKTKDGERAPNIAVTAAETAANAFGVPIGILLGTIERESDFRLDLISSAGAVGPCQFKRKFAADYYRYAGFTFDLETWDSVQGLAAVYAYYAKLGAKRYGYTGLNGWRYALCAHRWGQNSTQAKALEIKGRVEDVEAAMRRNGVWYDTNTPQKHELTVAERAVAYAVGKIGCRYSQPERTKDNVFDCSSLVARAYSAQGVKWDKVGRTVPLSCEEPYSDQFELIWPEHYADIGKKMGGRDVITKQPGDLQFCCTSRTHRENRITHVTIVADASHIVHARGIQFGVREDPITQYAGKICAVTRYNPKVKLRLGMRGERVAALQRALNKKGASLAIDGDYGKKTEEAVKRYGNT